MSTRKNRKLHDALADNQWIRDIALHPTISSQHLQQFMDLWLIVRDVHLSPGVADTIKWKWTPNGEYSAASAYRAQFLGSVKTKLQLLIWKPWAPQKCKFFAWLIIKNRMWTSDRLATRGWPRNEVCPLCRREQESAHHLLVKCRYTRRVWGLIAGWVGYPQLLPSHWSPTHSVEEWWTRLGNPADIPTKALRSLILLVNWKIWKERNARTFKRRETLPTMLFGKIKEEARAWGIAGAQHLASLTGV